MAVTKSGMYVRPWINALTGVHVIDLGSELHKVALFKNTITPDFSAVAADARYGVGQYGAANEISAPGYTAGGKVVTGTTVSESPSGTIVFDLDPVEWPGSSIVDARCAIVYAPYITTPQADPLLMLLDFGELKSSAGGLFRITWPSDVFTWKVVPS